MGSSIRSVQEGGCRSKSTGIVFVSEEFDFTSTQRCNPVDLLHGENISWVHIPWTNTRFESWEFERSGDADSFTDNPEIFEKILESNDMVDRQFVIDRVDGPVLICPLDDRFEGVRAPRSGVAPKKAGNHPVPGISHDGESCRFIPLSGPDSTSNVFGWLVRPPR